MTWFTLLIAVLLSSAGWQHTAVVGDGERPRLTRETLEAFSDGIVDLARDEFHIPGVAVSVVHRGELVFAKGYGWADEKNRIPVDPATTRFHVASISKTFTFTGLMQLVERELVGLDDPVGPILGVDDLDDGREPVLVRQLLSHNAGFETRLAGHFMADSDETDWPLMAYVREIKHHRVRPGDQWIVYSNFGSSLAGAVVETVGGMPFDEYMQASVLGPLEMENSAFADGPIPDEGDPLRAVGHKWVAGKYLDGRERYNHHGNYPAGGLMTTATDMAKFMRAHLGAGGLLEPETMAVMHGVLAQNHPQVQANRHGFWDSDLWGYSTLSHSGSIKGFKSSMVMIPELELGVFVATNAITGRKLSGGFAGRLLRTFFAPKRELPAVDPERDLSEYTGTFLSMRRGYTTIDRVTVRPVKVRAEGGYLIVGTVGGGTRWIPDVDDVFVSEASGGKIAFIRDEAGTPAMYVGGTYVMERVGPFSNPDDLVRPLVILCAVGIVLAVAAVRRRLRGVAQARGSRRCAWLLFGNTCAWITVTVAYGMSIAANRGPITSPSSVHFPSTLELTALCLLLLLIPLTLAAAGSLAAVWRHGDWRLTERLVSTLYVGLAAATLVWMGSFNLIGFNYG